MEITITIDTKDLKSLNTLDYFCNNDDQLDIDYEIYWFNKKEYLEELELKKQLKPGDVIYLTDFKDRINDVVLTIEHGMFSCLLNGYRIPYSNIILIK